ECLVGLVHLTIPLVAKGVASHETIFFHAKCQMRVSRARLSRKCFPEGGFTWEEKEAENPGDKCMGVCS
ncbi:hypothetical protein PIB30_098966, partial [Stylosanthes scabra]|nr:hypothetical protein [Stylosanthes scabra]